MTRFLFLLAIPVGMATAQGRPSEAAGSTPVATPAPSAGLPTIDRQLVAHPKAKAAAQRGSAKARMRARVTAEAAGHSARLGGTRAAAPPVIAVPSKASRAAARRH